MFELILTICLNTQPTMCAERLAPVAAATQQECRDAAPRRQAEWRKTNPDHLITNQRCVPVKDIVRPDFAIEEVAAGVFVHEAPISIPSPSNGGDLANIGFIIGDDAVAVIDAGGARSVGEQLYAAIRARTAQPITWLILTHMHPDHILGASVFHEAGAHITGHSKLSSALANRIDSYTANYGRLLGPTAYLGTKIIFPDTPIPNHIDLGNRILELKEVATAHTDNDVTVLDRQTQTLFVGDLVFVAHTPAIDGSIRGWQQALARLTEEPVARLVPGHGPASVPWPDGADAIRNYLAVLANETRKAIHKGESMRTAIEHIGESERSNWQLFDEYNPRNATTTYKELEWE